MVSGVANGIGLAVAKALGEVGHAIAIVGLDMVFANAAAAEFAEGTGARTCGVAADVVDGPAGNTAFWRIVERICPENVLVTTSGLRRLRGAVRKKARLV